MCLDDRYKMIDTLIRIETRNDKETRRKSMKLIRTEDAVGHVLCHDMTQIIPGVIKDARFRKGHIVTEEDIPVLLSIGKEHLYVWEKTEGMLHEDEGAERLRRITQNENMHPSVVKEGKIMFEIDGVDEATAREALRLASHKLPIKCKFVKKEESGEVNED